MDELRVIEGLEMIIKLYKIYVGIYQMGPTLTKTILE